MRYYKGKFFFVFYEEDDETFFNCFNNVKEILTFQKQVMKKNVEINQKTTRAMNIALYHALKREDHNTRIFGKTKKVYLVDITEEEQQ